MKRKKGKIEISVIMPALNEQKLIKKALQSIARQKTKHAYEIIVADGKSSDRTLSIAKKYADKIVFSKDHGIWAGRNAGARVAKGRLLVFIDADTMVPPNYLDTVHHLMADRRITGLSCGFGFDHYNRFLRVLDVLSNHYLYLLGRMGKGELQGFNCIIRKSDFVKVGGFPAKPLEDGAMARKLQKIGKVVYYPKLRVTTSARRMLQSGMLNSIHYYTDLEIMTYIPNSPLSRLVRHKAYHPLR